MRGFVSSRVYSAAFSTADSPSGSPSGADLTARGSFRRQLEAEPRCGYRAAPCCRRPPSSHKGGRARGRGSADSSAMSGPQTVRARASLAASPSNSLESACRKARSRSRAVFRPAVSTVRKVSAGSASRARPPTGPVQNRAAALATVLSGKYNEVMDPTVLARALGRRGGLARARRLTPAERESIGSLGGHARRESLQAARRIAANFQYLAAVHELRPVPKVKRLPNCAARLPGLYRSMLS